MVTLHSDDAPRDDSIRFALADGRRAVGRALGGCPGWEVGLMKISGAGPWPHAEWAPPGERRIGDLCMVLGAAEDCGKPSPRPVEMSVGCVAASAAPVWLATSCQTAPGQWGSGLFDLDGRLLGVTAGEWRGLSVHPTSDFLRRHWDAMVAGKRVGLEKSSAAPPGPPVKPAEALTEVALKRARPAVVWFRPGCSGVIVSPDGYIATCAHHDLPPGEEVKVFLVDGRTPAGKVLGSNPLGDVCLVKILDKDQWPHVAMGDSLAMELGQTVIHLGFPGGSRVQQGRPWGRASRVVDRPKDLGLDGSPRVFTLGPLFPGDSGGGLFDLQGRLIGIHQGGTGPHRGFKVDENTDWSMRIELLKADWDFLASGKPAVIEPFIGLGEIQKGFRAALASQSPFTVEVLREGRRRALGTVVSANGWVLTKASECYGDLACRLPDGRTMTPTDCRIARPHDLALLKVDASGLAVAAWDDRESLPPGTLLAALGGREGPVAAVLGGPVHRVEREPGWFRVGGLRDGEGGVEVHDDADARKWKLPIHGRDVILSVDGQPTPDLQTLAALLEKPDRGVPWAAAGDLVSVAVRRGQRRMELRIPLAGPKGLQSRNSDFPAVFDTALASSSTVLGRPLVGVSGRVAGIVIAQHRFGVYAIPAPEARRAMAELLSQ